MSTYCTEEIYNGKEFPSFDQFALKCIRGYGIFTHLNEDEKEGLLTRPVVSDYYENLIKKTENEFALFLKSTKEQRQKMFEIEIKKELEYFTEQINKERELKEKYITLKEETKAYKPPSKEYTQFKNYMLDQLDQSIKYDCGNELWYQERIKNVENITFEVWEEEKMEIYNARISNYKDLFKKEKETVTKINQQIDQLYQSLGVKE